MVLVRDPQTFSDVPVIGRETLSIQLLWDRGL